MTALPIHVYTPDQPTRAHTRLAFRRADIPVAEWFTPDSVDAFTRSSQVRRLEVWMGCFPEELGQHPRPAELRGLFIRAHDRRVVLCTGLSEPDLLDHLAMIGLFEFYPTHSDEWNVRLCPRCRCDATVGTDEGLWWCGRHSTRAWEPIEHREGVAWQEQRLPG